MGLNNGKMDDTNCGFSDNCGQPVRVPEKVDSPSSSATPSAIPPTMAGSFKLIKSEKFDEYMSAVGVGWALRKMASTAKPTTEITQEGDQWKIKTVTTFKTTEIKFRLGEEFSETTADGRQCISVITMSGENVLLHMQKCGGPPLRIIREFSKDEMKMVLEAPGGIVSTRVYKKQQ